MTPGTASAPAPGRRSKRAHEKVVAAGLELFEADGYARVTVDAIAARAGVSKATIYRWWPNKAAILMEGFLRTVEPAIAFPDSGSARRDISAQIGALARVLGATSPGRMALALLAEAQHDPQVAEAFRDTWIAPRREAGRAVLERGVARGELRAGIDPEVALDLLYGPLYLRLLVGHAAVDAAFIDEVVGAAFDGLSARHQSTPR